MRILVTNDDGIDADGLQALARVAAEFGDVIVVAPTGPQSGCSHRVTADLPFSVEERGPGRFAVDGTPADCVRVALHGLVPNVDWILSGINHGGNLGADVYHSGTVAAVREGALFGKPGIALSHYRGSRAYVIDWERAARWVTPLVKSLLAEPVADCEYWNVNLPSLSPEGSDPDVVRCPVDRSPHGVRYHIEGAAWKYAGVYQERPRQPGHDIEVCFAGQIAVSPLRL